MHIGNVRIRNFRALNDVEVTLKPGVNVIVGPNAIGKTSVLEGIRLAKALLAARTPNEPNQTLISIGGMTQHNPQQLIPEGLAGDPAQPVKIATTYHLSDDELALIRSSTGLIATRLVQARTPGLGGPGNLAAFLGSAQGRTLIQSAETEVAGGIQAIEKSKKCDLSLTIDFSTSRVDSGDAMAAAFLAFLDQGLPPNLAKFSYFPADRAMPRGEQPLQIGSQDSQQQLETHNTQPQNKYNRLKNTIVNTILQDAKGRDAEWLKRCDGKRLLADLHRNVEPKISLADLKRRIMLQMLAGRTEAWRAQEGLLKSLLSGE